VFELAPADAARLTGWFADEHPGPETAAAHTLSVGVGSWYVDRWPDPRTVLVECAENYLLRGSPDAVTAEELRSLVYGFVDAPPPFVPLLSSLSERFTVWDRVMYELDDNWPGPADPSGVEVRPLRPDDVGAIERMDPSHLWIAKTWGGPAGLAASGHAWGAFILGRLASVACTFFRGSRYEDIGVVTAENLRRRSLSTMCSTALCVDILARGRRPCWSTTADNFASRRVAEKSGFRWSWDGKLYVVGVDVSTDFDIETLL